MPKIAASATLDITKDLLRNSRGLDEFQECLLACCLDSPDTLGDFSQVINKNEVTGDFGFSDFTDPSFSLLYHVVWLFRVSWDQKSPYPRDRAEWILSLGPWMQLELRRNPDMPQELAVRAFEHVTSLNRLAPGMLELAYDGLTDYVTSVRYLRLEKTLKNAEPATRLAEYADVPRTVCRPQTNRLLPSPLSIMQTAQADPGMTVPFKTGFALFDRYYGHPALAGDAWLFYSGSGGGKTVLACDIAAFSAMEEGRKVLYVTTEMSPSVLLLRMVSAHMNRKYSLLMQVLTDREGTSPYAAEVNDWLLRAAGLVDVQWYADIQGSTPKEKLNRIVDEYEKKHGYLPEVVIFDWLGSALDQAFSDAWGKQEAYNQVAKDVAQLADDIKGITATFAQSKSKEIKSQNLHVSNMKDCSGLDQFMEGVCGITVCPENEFEDSGNEREENVKENQYFCINKYRHGRTGRIPVRRNFARMRFEDR